eukprot:scaffold2358_cov222-Skeletonema_menzelii.AAC.4
MSSILHSLRNLFGSPTSAAAGRPRRMTRARAQRIARGEEEELSDTDNNNDNDDDDDVFSAFGDDEEESSQLMMMMTQEENNIAAVRDAENNTPVAVDVAQQQQQDKGTMTTSSSNNNQQQHSQEDNDKITAMQEFFQHVVMTSSSSPTTTACHETSSQQTTLTYKQWKRQRKLFLMEYVQHRFLNDNDVEGEDDFPFKDAAAAAATPITMEESSFHSGVLDEEFVNDYGAGNDANPDTTTAAAEHREEESEESEEEDDDEDEEEPLQTQQLETQEFGLLSGIKRKLGFLSQSQEEQDDDDDEEEDGVDDQRTNNNTKRARMTTPPGQMWDGDLSSIPHVSDTISSSGPCHHLQEMDLSSSMVNLGLCRVLKVWGIRLTRRMNRLNEEMVVRNNNNNNSGFFGAYENDGPLDTIYKHVFSMEVVQLDHGSVCDNNNNNSRSTVVPEFYNPLANPKSAARKRRHAVRRVRIFFYGGYAMAMDVFFREHCRKDFVKDRKSQVLLSLVNVPPECIMPLSMSAGTTPPTTTTIANPHLQQYVNNPFGDEELGVPSPYCLCIGNESSIKLGEDEEKMRFDGKGRRTAMEIRLVEATIGLSVDNNLPLSDVVANDITMNDYIVRPKSTGVGVGLEIESGLIRQYLQLLKRQKEEGEVEFQNSVFNVTEYVSAASELRNDVQNVGVAGLRGTIGASARGGDGSNTAAVADQEANAENTDPNANSASTSEVFVRSRFVASLGSLSTMLIQGRRDAITVYGIVLGFSPPRITRMNTYMMSIVLIDETIPTSREVGADNEKELHVPSITLNLFAKHKSELPPVRSAGDVICCQKVLLQEYNNEPQLRAKKSSNIIVARPREARSPDEILQDSTSPEDWSLSDGRHPVDLELTNTLWRWGQRRLSSHPTMSPNCYVAISQVSDHVDNFEVSVSGDITAVVTSILPTPEHLRRSDTPRGFLRLWDGTGPSRSDPIPDSVVTVNNADQSITDPPEQVLVRLEKILKGISSAEQPDTTCAGVNAPLALCGRVINAIIWEEDLWNLIQRDGIISIGSFIRLRNINNAMLPSGSRVNCLSVHVKSSLTPLPHDAYEVKMLLKGHDTRLKRGVPTNPTSAILPSESAPRPQFTSREAAISGFSMLEECLRKPAPATFTVQFEVSHTLPASDLNSINTLKAFCVKQKDGSDVFRFAMHIKDASAEVDVICHGKVAEDLLGMSAQDVSTSLAKCAQALDILKDVISPGSVCEGKIRSVMGKDKRVYFVLCSMFCITS